MYDRRLILLPHIASLDIGVGAGCEIVDTYSLLAIGMPHLVVSAVFRIRG